MDLHDLLQVTLASGEALTAMDATDRKADEAELVNLLDWLEQVLGLPSESNLAEAHGTLVKKAVSDLRQDLENGCDPESLIDRLRECIQLAATLRTLGHWQSPTDEAGAMIYHRQQVPEDDWTRAVGTAAPFCGARSERVFFFSSFMGATAAFLMAAPDGPVLADCATYFETAMLVARLGQRRVHFVDPRRPDAFRHALAEIEPAVVLVDIAPNESDIPLTDLSDIVSVLSDVEPRGSRWTLLDHSLIGPIWDPLPEPRWPDELVVLGRSLQKLDQRGLDLASAGILIAYGINQEKSERLTAARSVLGVELPERSRWFLELPDRDTHRRRRLRAFRNGRWIRDALLELVDRWPGAVVNHASDPTHPIWNLPEPLWYWCPPILHITLPPHLGHILDDSQLFRKAIGEPPIPIGASYGFRHTRVSWWSEADDVHPRSMRVDVGLERAGRMPNVILGLTTMLDRLWGHKEGAYAPQFEPRFPISEIPSRMGKKLEQYSMR